MKALVIWALGLGSLVSFGNVPAARAQTAHRVVMEPFAGVGAPRLRFQTVSALMRLGEKVIPDRDVASAAASLRLSQPSDNYPAIARELEATLFVGGAVISANRRVLNAQLKIKNSSGVVVGRLTWTARTLPALLSRTQQGLEPRLKALTSREPANLPPGTAEQMVSGAPGPAAPSAEGQPAPEDVPQPVPVEDAVETAQPVPFGSAASDEESPESLGASAILNGLRSQSNHYDVSVGTQVYARFFAYNQSRVGAQTNYQVLGVPAPNLSVDYFVFPFLGITAGGEYSVPRASRDDNGTTYRTGSFGYWAGAKFRYTLSGIELAAGSAYGENNFTIGSSDAAEQPQVADVVYRQIKGGLSTRVPLSPTLTLFAGANYLHLLAVGELQTFFPGITGYGAEGFVGMGFRIMSLFEARATANLRRYGFSMNSIQGDMRQAEGAVDQYMGINLSVAIRD